MDPCSPPEHQPRPPIHVPNSFTPPQQTHFHHQKNYNNYNNNLTHSNEEKRMEKRSESDGWVGVEEHLSASLSLRLTASEILPHHNQNGSPSRKARQQEDEERKREKRKKGRVEEDLVIKAMLEMAAPSSGLLKTRTKSLWRYPNCFIASEAVTWLKDRGFAQTRDSAVNIGEKLRMCGFIRNIFEKKGVNPETSQKVFMDSADYFFFTDVGRIYMESVSPSVSQLEIDLPAPPLTAASDGEGDQRVSGPLKVTKTNNAWPKMRLSEDNRNKFSSPVERLPKDALLRIFSFLSVRTLCRVCQVSQRFREIGENNEIWRPIYVAFFSHHEHNLFRLAKKRTARQSSPSKGRGGTAATGVLVIPSSKSFTPITTKVDLRAPSEALSTEDELVPVDFKALFRACYLQELKSLKPYFEWESLVTARFNWSITEAPGGISKLVQGFLKKSDFQCPFVTNENVHSTLDFLHFSVVVIGPAQSGKTALIRRFLEGGGQEEEVRRLNSNGETVGARLLRCSRYISSTHVDFQIWELSGRERFRPLLPMYLAKAVAVVFCYSPWERYSVASCKSILKLTNECIKGRDKVLFKMVSTMADLKATRSEATGKHVNDTLQTLGNTYNCEKITPTSAKDKMNVEEVFVDLVEQKLNFLGLKSQPTGHVQ